MIRVMRWLLIALLLTPAPAGTQVAQAPAVPPPAQPAAVAPQVLTTWNPAADYITVGQDERGYRFWYAARPWRASQVRSFNYYLEQYGVGGIVPTWQLLRTATSWHRCGGEPFEVPPTGEWPHIVQTLRYIHDYVVPAIGPVEAVSAYRNPSLNACAGGAPESAHKHYSAIDLVPLRPTTRQDLMRTLCSVHAQRGTAYDVGLGFYAFLRFHVDTTRYRRWGADPNTASCPPISRPPVIAAVSPPAVPGTAAPAGADASTTPPIAPGPKIILAPESAPPTSVPQAGQPQSQQR
jgi:hypothetical protein